MSERMRWSEAEAVVRAYRAEYGATDVDVATLARALGTDVAEVRRLASRKRRFADASGVLSAALALAVVAAATLSMGPSLLVRNPLVATLLPASKPTVVYVHELRGPDSEFATRINRAVIERMTKQNALMRSRQLVLTSPDEPL